MKHSAGIILYRENEDEVEVLLVHPGGPYWQNKDRHGWSMPKGEFDENKENPEKVARREFKEETGFHINNDLFSLEPFKQGSSKVIHPFACKGELETDKIKSNTFEMEWPPDSGKTQEFPEVDEAGWFTFREAEEKLHKNQIKVLERLKKFLNE